MATYWQFRLIDGVFTGASFGIVPAPSEERIEQERHFGCGLWLGPVDPVRQRIDVAGNGDLVAWTRPKPADTQLETWAWNGAVDDYVSAPTLLAHQLERARDIEALLATLDLKVPRLAGEIAEALALEQPVPAEAKRRLVALNGIKQQLRDARAAALASTTLKGLQAVELPSTEIE